MKNEGSALKAVWVVLLLVFAAFFFLAKPVARDEKYGNSREDTLMSEQKDYSFRSSKLRDEHFEKHGREMGFSDAVEYESAASDVINNINALHKIEKEDGDDVYYLEDTNEFVIVSTDGYIRTYFLPDAGKAYYDRQ